MKITATLNEGFHANSHTPSDENLIPLKLTWEPGPVVAKDVVYPKPKMEKYAFSPDPLSVVSGSFDITTKFALAPGADVCNKKIVLVDDVTTSGTTFTEAARVLKAGGAKKILALAVAKA